jgi:hypothetical protein
MLTKRTIERIAALEAAARYRAATEERERWRAFQQLPEAEQARQRAERIRAILSDEPDSPRARRIRELLGLEEPCT